MEPSILDRLRLALRILFDRAFARHLLELDQRALPARPADNEGPAKAPAPLATEATKHTEDGALVLLSLLQREGRFVDFVMQDVADFADAEIGAVARVVHQGCRKAITAHVSLEPVRAENEGQRLSLQPGFDTARVKLTGNVSGAGPYRGMLRHRGWHAVSTRLPEIVGDHDVRVVAPAELEVE